VGAAETLRLRLVVNRRLVGLLVGLASAA